MHGAAETTVNIIREPEKGGSCEDERFTFPSHHPQCCMPRCFTIITGCIRLTHPLRWLLTERIQARFAALAKQSIVI